MTTGIAQSNEQRELAAALGRFQTESGRALLELVEASPVLLIFLRHFRCAYCAMALDRVSQARAQIKAVGVRPVFVHLGSPERAKPYFDYYHLSDVERISDPGAVLYQLPVFGLGRKNYVLHSLHPAVIAGWLKGAIFRYGIGVPVEDGDQMPGVFLLKDGKVAKAFRHRTIADEPDYLRLAGAR